MTDKLLIDKELVERIRQHLTELRELNDDLTWTDVSEVAELDGLKPAEGPVPTVEEIEACMESVPYKVHPDEPDVQYRELRDFSKAIHALLTNGRGGV